MTIQETGSDISGDGQYCYRTWRRWDEALPRLGFILLHPVMGQSRMIDSCVMRAVALDFGAIEVAYLFPQRALDPSHLASCEDPLGDRNKADGAIMDTFDRASTIIAAWGSDPAAVARAEDIKHMLQVVGYGNRLSHLGLNKDGSPKDMIQIRGRGKPKRWVL